MKTSQIREYVAQASAATYRISVWQPTGTPPTGGWPVLYVLDANTLFATFVEAIQRSGRRPDATAISMAAVVGIAHADERMFATEHRYRDYTFEPSVLIESKVSGGGEAFLAFIADQLAPELEVEFGFNPLRRSLFGHSLAGYFVLNALAIRPGIFSHYAAISPSVWWHPDALRTRLNSLNQDAVAHIGGVLVAVGEWEAEPAPWLAGTEGLAQLLQRRGERQMIANASAVADLLRHVLGESRSTYRCFAEEDHSSIVMIAVQRTLRLIFSPQYS